MTQSPDVLPAGVDPVEGIVHYRSNRSVEHTAADLSAAIKGAGAKIFAAIDQAAEAAAGGLELRPTRLIVFGNPRLGTSVMEVAPLAALDLPLKLLVWEAKDGHTWVTCLSGEWLRVRYGVPEDLAAVLAAPENLARRVTS
ncbi:MAG TPA: DUF302 domain-containing protein [Acidimicrobiales bacterium]|nr:DUF302 domain-containing protein [Acidimicrobiales bacterium]